MRTVYHHITDPAAFNQSVRRSLRPGGLCAVIDFEPGSFWHLAGRPEGAPASRRGHGMLRDPLVNEVTAAGFDRVRTIENWGGNLYLVLFRAK